MGTWLIDGLPLLDNCGSLFWLLAETSFLSKLGTNAWLTFQVALGLGFVIFVHELGHFLAAKTFGVRCDKFYVGFDVPIRIGPIQLPSTLGKFQWGETEYGIGIIPLGGYVKMLGQDDDPRKAEEEAAKLRLGEGEDAPLDPRSYPAKPVWQRMIIISAGVVMNLIFAVILAGLAYSVGVPYRPTISGASYAGGPAWIAGVQPGDQILRAGEMDEDDEHLRYDDFAVAVVSHGFEFKDQDLPLAIRRGDERITLTSNPTPKYRPEGFYLIGVVPPTASEVADPPYFDDSFLAQQKPDLQAGDKIVAVNGQPLPVNERYGQILGSELTSVLQAHWNQPVTVTVERTLGEGDSAATKSLEVELAPVPTKSLGLGFAMGPITAIRRDSPAAQSALQPGDLIEKVNGEPITNALELPAIIGRLAGETVTLSVRRGTDSEAETLEVALMNADQASFDPPSDRYGESSLAGLGIAFKVQPVVSSIEDALADLDLQAGDTLRQIHWILTDEEKATYKEEFSDKTFEPVVIDDETTLDWLHSFLQKMPEGSQFRAVLSRDGKNLSPITLTLNYADDWYWHQRGISMEPLTDLHVADDFSSAVQMGFWETSRRFKGVLNFLRLLVTGRIGMDGLGGPGRIAYVAASEASYGPARLMLFLTMLSANLAILNFLPIPALDGGHMVFLTAEAIRGKPVSEDLQIRLTMIGVISLLSLMAFVIFKDIVWFAS